MGVLDPDKAADYGVVDYYGADLGEDYDGGSGELCVVTNLAPEEK